MFQESSWKHHGGRLDRCMLTSSPDREAGLILNFVLVRPPPKEHNIFSRYASNILNRHAYPLVNKQFAIEHGPVEIVDFPIKHAGSFHSFVPVYQRVMVHVSFAWPRSSLQKTKDLPSCPGTPPLCRPRS